MLIIRLVILPANMRYFINWIFLAFNS